MTAPPLPVGDGCDRSRTAIYIELTRRSLCPGNAPFLPGVTVSDPSASHADPSSRPVAASGTFTLGGRKVHRLGYGAMQLTGPGIWGRPANPVECVRVLRRAIDLGVDLIDTADSYGPEVSEDLIFEALHPYPEDWSSPPRPA